MFIHLYYYSNVRDPEEYRFIDLQALKNVLNKRK